MNFKGESRFDAALVADAGANPASSNYLVAAIPSIVRIAFGGTTVAIAGVIEGHTEYSGCSDLSPSSNLVGCVTVRKDVVALKADSVCAPPLPNGSMRVFHGAGTADEENNAGRWTKIPDATLLLPFGQCRRSGGSGATLRAVLLRKPAIEKEARLRPQHYFIFGSGETRMQMQKNSMAGGLLSFAPPRSRSLL